MTQSDRWSAGADLTGVAVCATSPVWGPVLVVAFHLLFVYWLARRCLDFWKSTVWPRIATSHTLSAVVWCL